MTAKLRDPQKLTAAQVREAIFIVDDLADLAGKAPRALADPLRAIRARLKVLINGIDEIEGQSSGGLIG